MKKENGITLIALVVTIIILIILSAVTFSIILGENGVIDKARDGAENTKIQQVYEKLILEKAELAIQKEGGKILVDQYLQHIADKGIIILEENNIQSDGSASIIVENYEFLVEQKTENDIEIRYRGIAGEIDKTKPNEANIIITGSTQQDTLPISINIQVEHTDNESGVNINKCKWTYNTTAEEIGTDETLYTEEFNTNPEIITLSIEEEGEYYLHILTVDNRGNKKETIKGPITVSANYHTHVGSSKSSGGCYTTPVYHTHSGNNGYSTSSSKALQDASGCYAGAKYVTSKWVHKNNCSCGATSAANGGCGYGNGDTYYYVENYTCGKSTSTIEKYKLSCKKTGENIDNYIVEY